MNDIGYTKSDTPELARELSKTSELIGYLEDRVSELRAILNFSLPPSTIVKEINNGPLPMQHKVDMRIRDIRAGNRRLELLNDDLPNIISVIREI